METRRLMIGNSRADGRIAETIKLAMAATGTITAVEQVTDIPMVR